MATSSMCRPWLRLAVALLLSGAAEIQIAAADAQSLPFDIRAWPVALSESDSATTGHLRPRGMLQLPAFKVGNLRFSQLSGLAWDDDDEILYAISDKGALFHLRPKIENNKLVGATLLKVVQLTELKDGKPLKQPRSDSEGLDILRGRNGVKGDAELLVSFERHPRVMRYRPDGKALGELPLPAALADRNAYRGGNDMLEAACTDPVLGVLTTPERPLKDEPEGKTRIFSLNGKSWIYSLTTNYDISSMECLGDGKVLVLERDFGRLLSPSAAKLKLITLATTPSADTPVPATALSTLSSADKHQVDNFEGLARHKGNRFFMISDDNDLFVQRTLLLYFELLPQ